MASKHMSCSTLAISKMQIKMIAPHVLGWLKSKIPYCAGEDVRHGTVILCWRECKMVQLL